MSIEVTKIHFSFFYLRFHVMVCYNRKLIGGLFHGSRSKIKLVRLHRGLTQKQLGDLLNLGDGGANRIAQYEIGYRVPKPSLLKEIAKVLMSRKKHFS